MMGLMAAVEQSVTAEVVDGANPDTVAVNLRRSPYSPLRARQGTAPPDHSGNGADITLLGDPDDDTDPLTIVTGVDDTTRNGLKRALTDDGRPSLWAEPAPQTYDSAGSSAGTLGTPSFPIGDAEDVHTLGVAASHSLTNPATGFPLIIRPVISIIGARFETTEATLQAVISSTLDAGTPDVLTRDMSYGYGGSFTVALPAVTLAAGSELEVECDLQLFYRVAVTAVFEASVAGCQVVFQVTEYPSVGS